MQDQEIINPVVPQRHYIDQGHHLPRNLRESEIDKLFITIGDHLRDRTIFTLMLYAGLRVGETVNLSLGDIAFFIQNYGQNNWDQVSNRWLEDYIDAKLRENLAPTTVNWDLIALRTLCIFLLDEGYNIPKSMTKMSLLD